MLLRFTQRWHFVPTLVLGTLILFTLWRTGVCWYYLPTIDSNARNLRALLDDNSVDWQYKDASHFSVLQNGVTVEFCFCAMADSAGITLNGVSVFYMFSEYDRAVLDDAIRRRWHRLAKAANQPYEQKIDREQRELLDKTFAK